MGAGRRLQTIFANAGGRLPPSSTPVIGADDRATVDRLLGGAAATWLPGVQGGFDGRMGSLGTQFRPDPAIEFQAVTCWDGRDRGPVPAASEARTVNV
jgi:hypothetical protein